MIKHPDCGECNGVISFGVDKPISSKYRLEFSIDGGVTYRPPDIWGGNKATFYNLCEGVYKLVIKYNGVCILQETVELKCNEKCKCIPDFTVNDNDTTFYGIGVNVNVNSGFTYLNFDLSITPNKCCEQPTKITPLNLVDVESQTVYPVVTSPSFQVNPVLDTSVKNYVFLLDSPVIDLEKDYILTILLEGCNTKLLQIPLFSKDNCSNTPIGIKMDDPILEEGAYICTNITINYIPNATIYPLCGKLYVTDPCCDEFRNLKLVSIQDIASTSVFTEGLHFESVYYLIPTDTEIDLGLFGVNFKDLVDFFNVNKNYIFRFVAEGCGNTAYVETPFFGLGSCDCAFNQGTLSPFSQALIKCNQGYLGNNYSLCFSIEALLNIDVSCCNTEPPYLIKLIFDSITNVDSGITYVKGVDFDVNTTYNGVFTYFESENHYKVMGGSICTINGTQITYQQILDMFDANLLANYTIELCGKQYTHTVPVYAKKSKCYAYAYSPSDPIVGVGGAVTSPGHPNYNISGSYTIETNCCYSDNSCPNKGQITLEQITKVHGTVIYNRGIDFTSLPVLQIGSFDSPRTINLSSFPFTSLGPVFDNSMGDLLLTFKNEICGKIFYTELPIFRTGGEPGPCCQKAYNDITPLGSRTIFVLQNPVLTLYTVQFGSIRIDSTCCTGNASVTILHIYNVTDNSYLYPGIDFIYTPSPITIPYNTSVALDTLLTLDISVIDICKDYIIRFSIVTCIGNLNYDLPVFGYCNDSECCEGHLIRTEDTIDSPSNYSVVQTPTTITVKKRFHILGYLSCCGNIESITTADVYVTKLNNARFTQTITPIISFIGMAGPVYIYEIEATFNKSPNFSGIGQSFDPTSSYEVDFNLYLNTENEYCDKILHVSVPIFPSSSNCCRSPLSAVEYTFRDDEFNFIDISTSNVQICREILINPQPSCCGELSVDLADDVDPQPPNYITDYPAIVEAGTNTILYPIGATATIGPALVPNPSIPSGGLLRRICVTIPKSSISYHPTKTFEVYANIKIETTSCGTLKETIRLPLIRQDEPLPPVQCCTEDFHVNNFLYKDAYGVAVSPTTINMNPCLRLTGPTGGSITINPATATIRVASTYLTSGDSVNPPSVLVSPPTLSTSTLNVSSSCSDVNITLNLFSSDQITSTVPLVPGQTYILSFDATANSPSPCSGRNVKVDIPFTVNPPCFHSFEVIGKSNKYSLPIPSSKFVNIVNFSGTLYLKINNGFRFRYYQSICTCCGKNFTIVNPKVTQIFEENASVTPPIISETVHFLPVPTGAEKYVISGSTPTITITPFACNIGQNTSPDVYIRLSDGFGSSYYDPCKGYYLKFSFTLSNVLEICPNLNSEDFIFVPPRFEQGYCNCGNPQL